jgi:hypothetical protein
MRLGVTGGRDFSDQALVWHHLDRVHAHRPITMLVHGACPTGVDALADAWARDRGVPVEPHPAAWSHLEVAGAELKRRRDGTVYNAKAGPIRNTAMANSGLDGLVSFPGGWGTADMTVKAMAAGVTVMAVKAQ